ncbi:MAG TPA: GNAT family N-acetyltransferase [Bacteroidales bacterium]|nr:GNAT family N-acetyltransferase [Bacteroidales bacterium]
MTLSELTEKFPGIRLSRLTQDHNIKPFDCGEKDLNDFLFNDAKQLQSNLLWVTYVFETDNFTIAYFAVANDLLNINVNDHRDFKHELRSRYRGHRFLYKLFEQTSFPAVKLGRFGVTEKYHRQGIGSFLLDFIKYFFINNNKTGCAFITVDALNKCDAISFYEKNGFEILTNTDLTDPTRTMYYCLMLRSIG